MITDEQYQRLMDEIGQIKKESKDKGHFFIILALLILLAHSCTILEYVKEIK